MRREKAGFTGNAAHFEDRLQSCSRQTCPNNINHTKRILKTAIKRQSCILTPWQCWSGERLAGTPKSCSISDRMKGHFGLTALQRISCLLAWKNLKCSLALFREGQLSYHRVCRKKKKRTRDRAKIITQSNEKECQQKISKSNEKIFVVWRWQEMCPG